MGNYLQKQPPFYIVPECVKKDEEYCEHIVYWFGRRSMWSGASIYDYLRKEGCEIPEHFKRYHR